MWVIDLFRWLFFFIDIIIYPLIAKVYNLLMSIANTTIFTDDIIDLFASKVYALLGIFMLFKVSFSIMTYIVNPDEFADKSKGFSKLISNIMVTLVLLVTTPWIFSQAMDIQRIVLNDNILGKVFTTAEVSNVSDLDAGNTMAYETFLAFYYVDTEATGYMESCKGAEEGKTPDSPACRTYLGEKYETFRNIFDISYVTKDVSYYNDFSLVTKENPYGEYIMSYQPLISSLAGGFICWILIMFCFDIAVRSVKLGFLRMIAPVPIISRIDPKKGMDTFNKWVKSCTSTYLDLFVRLLAIYFAVFVISLVGDMQFVDASTGLPTEVDAFVKIFIIMGALLFAKQLPKLLEELTGLKMDGKFTMNPLKKVAEVPLVGNAASRTLGAAGSLMAGQGFKAGWKEGGKAVPLLGGNGSQSIATGFNRYNRFTDDGKKMKEEQKKHELGEKLLNDALVDKRDKNGNIVYDSDGKPVKEVGKEEQYNIYKGANSSTYAASVREKDAAKDRRNDLQSNYEKMQLDFEAKKANMTAAEVDAAVKAIDDARVAYVKADSDYKKAEAKHNYVRSQDSRNAEIEDAFNSAKDAYETSQKLKGYTKDEFKGFAATGNAGGNSTNVSPSNSYSNTTVNQNVNISNSPTFNNATTVEGVKVSDPTSYSGATTSQGVSLNPGDTVTQGGIILPSGYDRPSSKKTPEKINLVEDDSSFEINGTKISKHLDDEQRHNSEW